MATKTSPGKRRKYEDYKNNHTREKNKINKILKHLKKYPGNANMLERIEQIKALIKK